MPAHYWNKTNFAMSSTTRQQVTLADKNRIVSLFQDRKSLSEISTAIGRSRSIVQRIVARYKQFRTVDALPKTGRPPKTTPREDRSIVRKSMNDRFNTAAQISREMGVLSGGTVSRTTVSRRLQQAGLRARVPASKPLISKKNQKVRLVFAQEHVV